jgi:DUF917 family protein
MMLGKDALKALIQGGCFFGSGGGGTLESANNLLNCFAADAELPPAQRYYPKHEIPVVTVPGVEDGSSVVVAYLGAPARIANVKYPEGPVRAVEQVILQLSKSGRQSLKYIVPPESGALGFLVACLVAAKFDLAVVDGDGAGRAVPSLPMLTFASECVPPRPAYLASQSLSQERNSLVVELDVQGGEACGSHEDQENVCTIIEHMLRPIVSEPEFGQFGGLALWIMDRVMLQQALRIPSTLKRAWLLGRALLDQKITTGEAMVQYLASLQMKPCLLCSGRFASGTLDTSGGFDLGRIEIENETGGKTLVLYQNESLIAWQSDLDHPRAMAPDSIAYFLENVTNEDGSPQYVASNGDLVDQVGNILPKYANARVTVIGIPADPVLRETKGPKQEGLILRSFMDQLRTMGYFGPYVPVEELCRRGSNAP